MTGHTDIITILSRKGGSGKSTSAVHLAVAAGNSKRKVALIDIDPQGSASLWGKLREQLTQVTYPLVVPTQSDNLTATIRALKESGIDVIIIDTAPHIHAPSLHAAKAADYVLIPARPNLFDIAALQQTAEIVTLARKPSSIILNAVPSRAAADLLPSMAAAAGQYGLVLCPVTLGQRADYAHALQSGHSVQEHRPKGRAAHEVKLLWTWMRGELAMRREEAATAVAS
jgi:chromosome partitioning protein